MRSRSAASRRELEFTGLLDFLESSSIQPGHSPGHGRCPDGTMTVEIDGRHVGVGSFASATSSSPRVFLSPSWLRFGRPTAALGNRASLRCAGEAGRTALLLSCCER